MVNVKTDLFKLFRIILLIILFMNKIEGQSKIDFKSLEFNSVKENIFQRPITSMVLDKHGFIWIGTEGAGLYRFNGFSYTYFRHDLNDVNSINSNSISSLFIDESGKLWIGTDAGLCVYNEKQNSFKRFKTQSSDNTENNYINIICFAQFEDRFLVGTYDGIKEINFKDGLLKDYGLSGSSVLDLKFSTKGNLYLATDNGLMIERFHQRNQFEKMTLTDRSDTQHVTKLHIDKRESLWVGTLKSGTFKADLKKARTSFLKLDIVESTTMSITSNINNVFVAIENEGLIVFDMNGDIIKHYQYNVQDSNGIGSDSVWSMLIDNENRLWLGYYENGLGFFNEHHNKFKSIQRGDIKNRIVTNDIKAFAKSQDGEIWIAQINGIDILRTDNKEIINVYGGLESDYKGLKKDIYIENIFIDSKGNVWLATWGNGIFFLKKGTKTFLKT